MDRDQTSVRGLSSAESCDTIPDVMGLTDGELERLERQLRPLLNTVLLLRGKSAVVNPEGNGHGSPVDVIAVISKTFPVTAITVRWGASRAEIDIADLIASTDPISTIRKKFI